MAYVNRFRTGRRSIDDSPRPRRPKISTEERKVKLVADALEKYRGSTYEELSEATSAFNILTNDLSKRNICAGQYYLHDNARPQTSNVVSLPQKLSEYGCKVLPHPP
ncbi:hypothetical protein C0J52_25247 [Blattella germanica]|nr:hypothetical protein C0J52_25247 [Blattella germanica]